MKTLKREQTRSFTLFKVLALIMLIISFSDASAGIVITGKVTAEDGSVLPGVTVLIKGTSRGTTTNLAGIYSLEIPDPSVKLEFSFVGYLTAEVNIGSKNTIDIKLVTDTKYLDEVEVIGYGTQKKFLVTGSVSKVSEAEIKTSEPYPVKQTLQGKVAGVNVGRKDNAASVRIRGVASAPCMIYNSNPVYLDPSNESYNAVNENGFSNSKTKPLSTFSIDVDRASYTNVKRFLNEGQKPPADAVRVEEMINYFEYDYPQPADEHPFSISTEYSDCPWQKGYKLLHIGLQGKKIAVENLPPSNLVFLIDVSAQ